MSEPVNNFAATPDTLSYPAAAPTYALPSQTAPATRVDAATQQGQCDSINAARTEAYGEIFE